MPTATPAASPVQTPSEHLEGPESGALDLSVLVVSYKTRDLTLRCIQSVIEDLGERRAEILVADNDSRDGTVEALKERFPHCKVHVHDENLGFGRAHNDLARLACGKRLLILNPDTELHPGCLSHLDLWLDEHPDAAIAGPRTLYPDGREQDTAFAFPSLGREFLMATGLGPILRHVPIVGAAFGGSGTPARSRPVDYVQGSCLLCRREAWLEVDGFDESYFLFSEEVDLQRRLRVRGWRSGFVAQASLTHHHGKSMEQDPVRNYVELYRSKLRYFGQHLSAARMRAVRSLWTLFHGSRWLVLAPLAALTRSDRWRIKAQKHRAILTLLRAEFISSPDSMEAK